MIWMKCAEGITRLHQLRRICSCCDSGCQLTGQNIKNIWCYCRNAWRSSAATVMDPAFGEKLETKSKDVTAFDFDFRMKLYGSHLIKRVNTLYIQKLFVYSSEMMQINQHLCKPNDWCSPLFPLLVGVVTSCLFTTFVITCEGTATLTGLHI